MHIKSETGSQHSGDSSLHDRSTHTFNLEDSCQVHFTHMVNIRCLCIYSDEEERESQSDQDHFDEIGNEDRDDEVGQKGNDGGGQEEYNEDVEEALVSNIPANLHTVC